MKFRIVFWYEKLNSGPIKSVSVNSKSNPLMIEQLGIPELIVTTSENIFLLSKPVDSDRGAHAKLSLMGNSAIRPTDSFLQEPSATVLVAGIDGINRAFAVHPEATIFAIGGSSGILLAFDYFSKSLLKSRRFFDDSSQPKNADIYCVDFSSSGKTLAVGFSNGIVRFLDFDTLEDLPKNEDTPGYAVSNSPITRAKFSPEGDYCAFVDNQFYTYIFHKETVKVKRTEVNEPLFVPKRKDDNENYDSAQSSRNRLEWVFIGRIKSHFQEIVCNQY
jgi:WD40 repeat protein